jgi:hypothetical protein
MHPSDQIHRSKTRGPVFRFTHRARIGDPLVISNSLLHYEKLKQVSDLEPWFFTFSCENFKICLKNPSKLKRNTV